MGIDLLLILKAIIIAIVEGLTEFVPVSSTGHMILVGNLIDFTGEFANMFEVVIQLGAILAVVVLFWKKISTSVVEFFKFIFTKGREGETGFRFGINVIVGSIPALIVGLALHDKIKSLFTPRAVIYGFIVGGILLIVIENTYRKRRPKANDIDKITAKEALIVGVAQCFAMWPGMSRSASTIMGGWIAGLSTPIAAEFSFFLAIPAMVGSSGLDMLKFDYSQMDSTKWIALAVGFVVAFIVSLIVMDKFISYLKKKPMRVFAVYRIIVGVILAVLVFAGFMTLPPL
ncbi:undecaprenyl-diphosphate phosphatase [Clostridium sardiniense]|uniref:Undecaprenyl-diphosphatase n=1 Tax=Clostridium sardiniense TaxID=29369 RepID=A0ABS7L0X9_CLOSR|nr:undecaprenyl-diphosphate phosphatase [Clostridium sardiniense]MBM7835048.1 undecaprenyl-diphosphatase [Clostridium sardiniense]MBY0756552.1 undecaprenyl-diphosphate phosphatase [Clostridium sardiniense]MDQ0460301.1 undecaprenyl-diphosphatase [Clostridium sardiniense]